MKKYTPKSIHETENIAKQWLMGILDRENIKSLENKSENEADVSNGSAFVVGLSGHLGAGKTAFVKCVAKLLGIKEDITSPTYVIMKIYDIDNKILAKNFGKYFPWRRLVHIDAYRLERQEELQGIDWEGVVADKNNLILIEWPENVKIGDEILNAKIEFEIVEGEYKIEVK